MRHQYGGKQTARGGPERLRGNQYYCPAVDILEKGDEILLVADVPGAKPDDIDVQFEDGLLTVHAKVATHYPDDVEWLQQEYGVGDYLRTFQLSEVIDVAKISAEYANGVLTLHLPKSAGIRLRKIPVNEKGENT